MSRVGVDGMLPVWLPGKAERYGRFEREVSMLDGDDCFYLVEMRGTGF